MYPYLPVLGLREEEIENDDEGNGGDDEEHEDPTAERLLQRWVPEVEDDQTLQWNVVILSYMVLWFHDQSI